MGLNFRSRVFTRHFFLYYGGIKTTITRFCEKEFFRILYLLCFMFVKVEL